MPRNVWSPRLRGSGGTLTLPLFGATEVVFVVGASTSGASGAAGAWMLVISDHIV